jgi:hypothetical protein
LTQPQKRGKILLAMSAPLSVIELEAQIHALSLEDKLRIARFTERELAEEPAVYDEPPEWVKDELLRREMLVEEGKMEIVDIDTAFTRIRAKLGYAS